MHQQLAEKLHQMQKMMQDTKMKYSAAPHPTYQDYESRGIYGGEKIIKAKEDEATNVEENWQSGHGGRVSSDLTHYCLKNGICTHPFTNCTTPSEGHKKNRVLCNKVSGSEYN